jgi:hypothetical protein
MQNMTEAGITADLTSRRVIDVAIGILMALRGCTEKDAFDDLARAVRETRVGLGAIAGGLVDLVGGGNSSPQRDAAFEVWGELLAGRGTFAGSSTESRVLSHHIKQC